MVAIFLIILGGFSLQMTRRCVQTHTQIQTLAVLDMQTQMQALTAVHVVQELQCITTFLVGVVQICRVYVYHNENSCSKFWRLLV